MPDKISIMSMNCRGLGDTRKRRDVMHYIRSKQFSIVFLQDTHLIANQYHILTTYGMENLIILVFHLVVGEQAFYLTQTYNIV